MGVVVGLGLGLGLESNFQPPPLLLLAPIGEREVLVLALALEVNRAPAPAVVVVAVVRVSRVMVTHRLQRLWSVKSIYQNIPITYYIPIIDRSLAHLINTQNNYLHSGIIHISDLPPCWYPPTLSPPPPPPCYPSITRTLLVSML